MSRPAHRRRLPALRPLCASLALSLLLTATPLRSAAQPPADEPASTTSQPDEVSSPQSPASPIGAHTIEPIPGPRKLRAAESAYLAGAKKLEQDDLDAAENQFKRALALDPQNRDYALAISVTRQHRVTELVQQSGKARLAGDQAHAELLLAQARDLDPENPIVTEHLSAALLAPALQQPQPPPAPQTISSQPATDISASRATQAIVLSGESFQSPIKQPVPLASAIQLTPSPERKSFHLRGDFQSILQQVAGDYGIRTSFDDTVDRKTLRFDLEDVPYGKAMSVLNSMTQTFAVPLDSTSILLAKDTPANRQRLERQLEETIYLPGLTPEKINEIANVVRTVFDIKQATVQTTSGSIVVRAPQDVLTPMNETVQGLMESDGEVMVEIKLYEVNTTRSNNTGAATPTTAGIYSVEQAATALVNANQSLVQQAIAQGFISATDSNIVIAGKLIGSGLVQSSLLSSTIGSIGGGLTLLGITASTNTSFNFGQNTSDTRALDDIQLRVGDHEPATLREGTRYPIVASTYTTGLSTAASALSNASINGVSVASLLSQYAGGTSATIPQVTYEDLGITLQATPTILKSGHINLLLNLKIQAISGSSSSGMPTLENRQFASDITLNEGDSAMLVSNVTRIETAAMSGIPGLSELPGFQLPTLDNAEKDTSQLVAVVIPHIVRRHSESLLGPRIAVRNAPAN